MHPKEKSSVFSGPAPPPQINLLRLPDKLLESTFKAGTFRSRDPNASRRVGLRSEPMVPKESKRKAFEPLDDEPSAKSPRVGSENFFLVSP